MRKKGNWNYRYAIFLFVIILLCVFVSFKAIAVSSGSSQNATAFIWTTGTLSNVNFTFGSIWSKTFSDWNFRFFSNYTNSSNYPINASNGNGLCQINFNETGAYSSFVNMSYNSSSFMWEFNRSFTYYGNLSFKTNCTSGFGNISLIDSFFVQSTRPWINKTEGTGIMSAVTCIEDNLSSCTYNLSSPFYLVEDDLNDIPWLIFSNLSNTTLVNYSFSSAGNLVINRTIMNQSEATKYLYFTATDRSLGSDVGQLPINIQAINDAPVFVNLINKSFNMSEAFEYVINVTDEENNIPFVLNISFLNCSIAQWSSRNCSNSSGRELFNSSQYSFNATSGKINISFTPTRNDVGNYTINFTVRDTNNFLSPINASTSQIVNFQVLNTGEIPYFTYVCNNERNATEDTLFQCRINVTDNDEISNLTVTVNETWFLFNSSNNNSLSNAVNITTGFNASFLVNFTPRDNTVGNWSLNISVVDTFNPRKTNSTIVAFSVANINDSVLLQTISNMTVFTTNNYTIYVNATDDDLLIPDKRVYNEALRFSSNVSWVNISSAVFITNTNTTQIRIDIYPNSSLLGNTSVNITVRDANNFSSDSKFFVISAYGNNAPIWNQSTQTSYSLTEGVPFFLNLSLNVTDPDINDKINFSAISADSFPSFSINLTTGVINITSINEDVGLHQVVINATDGRTGVSLAATFSVANVNNPPAITTPLQGINISVNETTSNMTLYEDSPSKIILWVSDNDLKIPSAQKSYYNETLSISNLTIQGNNINLFNFSLSSSFPTSNFPNRTEFTATFTPNKSDIGNYLIFINVTDHGNLSSAIRFNMTIFEISHAPVLSPIQNQNVSILETFFFDFNATDIEEINESTPNSNLTYKIINLTAGGNFLTINRSTGVINVSMNQTFAGFWAFNVSVNDSSGLTDFKIFNLTVYDYPKIVTPLQNTNFSLVENSSSILDFIVNHTVGTKINDTLNVSLFYKNILNYSTIVSGNLSSFSWNVTPSFTDETGGCHNSINISLNVSNYKLSNFSTWSVNINHTEFPLSFISDIGVGASKLVTGGNQVSLTLSDYFSDIDASDTCINQSIGFTSVLINSSSGSIDTAITNWTNGILPTVSFSAASTSSASFNIIAQEYNVSNSSQVIRNVTSNDFTVELTVSTTTTPTGGGSGGGGGGTTVVTRKIIGFKLIMPDLVSVYKKGKIVIPIRVVNLGNEELNYINLTDMITTQGVLAKNMNSSFDRDFIQSLSPKEEQNVSLTVDIINGISGLYEITINGTVKQPSASDWGKIYLEMNSSEFLDEKIIFTEELIASNPECAEVRDFINEAQKYSDQKQYALAENKVIEAINACKELIAQSSRQSLLLNKAPLLSLNYLSAAVILSIILGLIYYFYGRNRLTKQLVNSEEEVIEN